MNVTIAITDEDVERIAARVVELLAVVPDRERWLDVPAAARHLAITENALRALVKRRRIPFHRTENGRLRFSPAELDGWVRTRTCAVANEDLP